MSLTVNKPKLTDIEGSGGGGKSGGGGGSTDGPDTLITNETIKVLHLLGEGVCNLYTGDGQSIFLNNIPLINPSGTANFGNTYFEFRSGTSSQAPMTNPAFPSASSVYSVGQAIAGGGEGPPAAPAIYDVVAATTDYCLVAIQFPNGLVNVDNNGNIIGDSVEIGIDTRPHTSSSWNQIILRTISGKSSSTATIQFFVPRDPGAAGALWDIRVRRLTPDNGSSTRKNNIVLYTVEEVEQITLSYDGVAYLGLALDAATLGGSTTAVPTISVLMQGVTVQIPSNYNPATSTYTGLWDGTFTTGVTDNPAWHLYDMLTNADYGCGLLGITAAQVDKYSFYNAAVFNDALVPSGVGSGTEKRFTFNAPIQNRQDMLTTLSDMAGMMNGVLGMVNGLVTLFQDRPSTSKYAVNKSNVIGGGSDDSESPVYFTYASSASTSRTTVCNVTWTDASDLRYLPKTSSVSDPTGLARYGYQSYDLAAFGATTEGQAIRAGRWWLFANLYQQETVTFKTGLDGFNYNLYDVFDLYDDDYTDRVGSGRVVSATTNTVTLDQPVIVDGGSPTISVVLPDGVTYETHAIVGTGTMQTLEISGTWSVTPTQYCPFIITSAVEPRQFRITDIKVDGPSKEVTVIAQLYDQYNYEYVEEGILVPEGTYTQPNLTTVADVTNITFTPTQYINATDNQLQRGVVVAWTPPSSSQVVGYILKWRKDSGQYNTTPKFVTPSYELDDIVPGEYDFIVYACNLVNSTSPGLPATYVLNTAGGGTSSTLSEITGLEIIGGGVDFSGQACSFQWTNPAANQGLLKNFFVTISDPVTSDVLRTISVAPVAGGVNQVYDYLYSQNLSDGGPRRSINVRVQGVDSMNNMTAGATATFTNPAPGTPTGVNITGGLGANFISYTQPADADFEGSLVWRSTSSSFTPAESNLIYCGPDVACNDVGLATTPETYYYIIASWDSFYSPAADSYNGTGLNKTAILSATTVNENNVNQYLLQGVTFTPNSPSTNQVSWTAGTGVKTSGVSAGETWAVSAGNATWSSGTLYIYLVEETGTLGATPNITSAISSNSVIVATYHGGTNLAIGNGNAYMDGAYLIAGTVGASQLVTGSAVITGTAQIAYGIIEDAQIVNLNGSKITANSISASSMVTGTITASSGILANASVGSAQIQNLSVETIHIASGNISTVYSTSTTGSSCSLTVTIPSGSAALVVQGFPGGEFVEVYSGGGKDGDGEDLSYYTPAGITLSNSSYGSQAGSGATCYAFSNPTHTGSQTFTATRDSGATFDAPMVLLVFVTQR